MEPSKISRPRLPQSKSLLYIDDPVIHPSPGNSQPGTARPSPVQESFNLPATGSNNNSGSASRTSHTPLKAAASKDLGLEGMQKVGDALMVPSQAVEDEELGSSFDKARFGPTTMESDGTGSNGLQLETARPGFTESQNTPAHLNQSTSSTTTNGTKSSTTASGNTSKGSGTPNGSTGNITPTRPDLQHSLSAGPATGTAASGAAVALGPGGTMGGKVSAGMSDAGSSSGLPHAHAEADEYYGGKEVWARSRTYSNVGVAAHSKRRPYLMGDDAVTRNRRLSHDELSTRAPRRFLIDVEETLRIVLEQEDTDRDFQISVYDSGPKLLSLGTASSNAYKSFDIRGNYMLSNLLQELALARDYGRKRIVLDEARLCENPVDRLSRMIKNSFWNSLTRRIDGDGLELICADPKNRSRKTNPLIYVPHGEPEMAEYYREVARKKPKLGLQVEVLPPKPDDPEFVKSLNETPGILALAMKKKVGADGKTTFEGLPFVVPGARFNEFYYWDSYFCGLGLLVDGKRDMAMNHVEHFIFEIKHYNKVLNGNRSYYLARSQPPFVTDLALQIFNQMPRDTQKEHIPWLKRAMRAAIKEYHTYWMVPPSLDIPTGLSRYRPGGRGIPPETEATHFTHILQPYAEKHGISVLEFIDQFNDGELDEPELEEYFMHDRGVRESGHDTTYRFEKRCANLATIDLNALLFKYEHDIATAIRDIFGDELEMEDEFDLSPFPITQDAFNGKKEKSTSRIQTSEEWYRRAAFRKQQIDKYCWNEGQALYFDYDTKKKRQSRYESVTTFFAMWAGCASEHQAERMMYESLRKFEVEGGLVSGTEESRGRISLDRPNRQWDFPYGWAPHQIMTWVGMERYGFQEECQRLAYRWTYMMTTAFVDYNGVVPEKFDVVKLSHLVDAEYGNQGLDFKMLNREGFAWTNASFQIGLHFLTIGMRRAVAACTPPDVYFRTQPRRDTNADVLDAAMARAKLLG